MTETPGTEAEIAAKIGTVIEMEISGNRKSKKNSTSQSSEPHTLTILKLKWAKPSKHPFKILFTEDSETIKELVNTFQDGDSLDHLIAIQLHMLQLRDTYGLFKDGKLK